MNIRSLRLRLFMLATIAVAVAMIVSGIGLVALFGRHVERRIAQELETHILQLAGNLRFNADGHIYLDAEPGDPRFEKVFGGLYWQVIDQKTDVRLRSVSLWDTALPLTDEIPRPGATKSYHSVGPDGAPTLVHDRRIILTHDHLDRPMRIAVAINVTELASLKTGFAFDLLPGLVGLALALLAGLWWQVNAGLKPIGLISAGIKQIREGEAVHLSTDVPDEMLPLVGEVNTLLDAQTNAMTRARDRAADLAHGLKTPLTALMSDVTRLRQAGQSVMADDIEGLAQRMRQIVERELARSRIRNASTHYKPVSVKSAAQAVIRTLMRTPDGENRDFRNLCAEDAMVAVDHDDLNDLLGNLVENATRAARSRVAVTAQRRGPAIWIDVSDDGPGVAPDEMEKLIERGIRLDQSSGSAGLGLSLVADILAAYGSKPVFAKSELGGLSVSFALPDPPARYS